MLFRIQNVKVSGVFIEAVERIKGTLDMVHDREIHRGTKLTHKSILVMIDVCYFP